MSRSRAPFHGPGLLAILAAMACVPAPATAQEQTVIVEGAAEQMCSLGQPEQGEGALVNFDTPSGAIFAVTRLADPETLSTQAANVTLSLEAMCNGLHRVAVASDNNGLWRQGGDTAPTGFASAVPYRANLVWADAQHLLTADTSSRQYVQEELLVGRPNTGELLIEFEIGVGATNAGVGAPLLAGEYSDVLRVTVEPQ